MIHEPLFHHALKLVENLALRGKDEGKFVGISEPFKEDILTIKNIVDRGSANQTQQLSDMNAVSNILIGVKASADAEGVANVLGSIIKKLSVRITALS